MRIEIRKENSVHSGAYGHRIYIDGKKGGWHYGSADNTTISVYRRYIQRVTSEGGEIINYDTWDNKPKVYQVEGCPTNHANIADDFMGGQVCLDCKAVW